MLNHLYEQVGEEGIKFLKEVSSTWVKTYYHQNIISGVFVYLSFQINNNIILFEGDLPTYPLK